MRKIVPIRFKKYIIFRNQEAQKDRFLSLPICNTTKKIDKYFVNIFWKRQSITLYILGWNMKKSKLNDGC